MLFNVIAIVITVSFMLTLTEGRDESFYLNRWANRYPQTMLYTPHDHLITGPTSPTANEDELTNDHNVADNSIPSYSTKQEDIDLFFQPSSTSTRYDSASPPVTEAELFQTGPQVSSLSPSLETNELVSSPAVDLVLGSVDSGSVHNVETYGQNTDYGEHIKTFPGSTSKFNVFKALSSHYCPHIHRQEVNIHFQYLKFKMTNYIFRFCLLKMT